MNKTFALTAVATALLSTAALAQTTTPQAGSSSTLGVPSGAAVAPIGPAQGLPITDTPQGGKVFVQGEQTAQINSGPDFVRQAANSGWFEVQSSRVALDKTTRESVRNFARRMVDEHTLNNQQLAGLARAQGIEPPSQPDLTQQQKLAQMQTLSGATFDRTYVTEQVMAHRQAVELFQTAASNNAPDLQPYQSYIAQTLPTLQQHLRDAEALAGGPPVAEKVQ